MRRRRLLLVGLGAVVLPACGLFVWVMSPTPGVSRENFLRIRKGMTLSEVEAILGEPGKRAGYRGLSTGWSREKVLILITVDETKCVRDGMHRDYAYPETDEWGFRELQEEGFLDRLCRLLRL
jgi:hypothetical protein